MRIITDGQLYAVAKGRWIFTKVASGYGNWYKPYQIEAYSLDCWTTKEKAEHRLKRFTKKWKDA